jgi:hypothetical protein
MIGRQGSIRAIGALVLALASLAVQPGLADATPSKTAHAVELPSARHLIVGNAIKLPNALFESGEPGKVPLVTPVEARDGAAALWQAWETALVMDDTRALSQLVAPGPLLSGELANCAVSPRCVTEASPRPLGELHVIVPIQTKYPIDFLAEIRTTYNSTQSNGLTRLEPWIELQVLTKASARAPWQLSFDSGYGETDASKPSLMPFALEPAYSSVRGENLYNSAATSTPPVPVARFLPMLAAYWQSWKDTGHPPPHTIFQPGGYTTVVGAGLATSHQNSLYLGSRQTFEFAVDPAAGHWEFTLSGLVPMTCGTIVDAVTTTPLTGFLNQNPDESNYGVPLPPGEYRQITLDDEHETCVFAEAAGLNALGNISYFSKVTGKLVPAATSSALDDLETNFGSLAYQLGQYQKSLIACEKAHPATVSCIERYGQDSELEIAGFEAVLTRSERFPGRARTQVAQLASTAQQLAARFEELHQKGQSSALMTSISREEQTFVRQYQSLVKALS